MHAANDALFVFVRGEKMALGVPEITLSIIVGTLAAIVYSLRVLVLMDRRMERIEVHIEKMAEKIVKEELRIEKAVSRRK